MLLIKSTVGNANCVLDEKCHVLVESEDVRQHAKRQLEPVLALGSLLRGQLRDDVGNFLAMLAKVVGVRDENLESLVGALTLLEGNTLDLLGRLLQEHANVVVDVLDVVALYEVNLGEVTTDIAVALVADETSEVLNGLGLAEIGVHVCCLFCLECVVIN